MNLDNNEDSKLANYLKEYLELLKKNDYKLTEEVGEKRNQVFDKFQKKLDISFFN